MKKARTRKRASQTNGRANVIRSDSSRVVARTSATAAALANAMIFSGNAQAQTAEPEEPTATTSEVVVRGQAIFKPTNVESRQYTEPLRDIPQSITVIPRALIEEQNAVSLRDVLRNVPGISMQAGEGGGGPGQRLGRDLPDQRAAKQTAVELTGVYHNLLRQWSEL